MWRLNLYPPWIPSRIVNIDQNVPKLTKEHFTLSHNKIIHIMSVLRKRVFNKCVVHKRKYKVFNAICFDWYYEYTSCAWCFMEPYLKKSLVSGNFAVRIGLAQDEDKIRIFSLPIIRHLSGKKNQKTYSVMFLLQPVYSDTIYMILEMFIIMYVSCLATFFCFSYFYHALESLKYNGISAEKYQKI